MRTSGFASTLVVGLLALTLGVTSFAGATPRAAGVKVTVISVEEPVTIDALADGILVTVTCNERCTVRSRIVLSAGQAAKLGLNSRIIGSASAGAGQGLRVHYLIPLHDRAASLVGELTNGPKYRLEFDAFPG